ncbi:sensor domain-containing diguanylate cyclase [Granulicella sibirica]|uniref:sensor domain-containing diguanylate cyclase n=1 Tax=Granulicella sibirica TaxID=2479048 RepID=UPI001F4F6A42|nr:diguanylate cyclase [Granulicella sibirica]
MNAEVSREERRLRALHELHILDTPHETEYDEIVELAAAICGTPISLISLVDRDRQWFKSALGVTAEETPRSMSFCAHAIETADLFVVENAAEDARFRNNPLVTGEMCIRFYAGFPVSAMDGNALGTLCVIDRKPRTLTREQSKALEVLSKQVEARIELRAKRVALEQSLEQQKALSANLRASESLFRTFMNNSPFVSYIKDADGRMLYYNRIFAEVFGITADDWLGKLDHEIWPTEKAAIYRAHDLEVLAEGEKHEYVEEAPGADGKISHYRSLKFPYADGNGNIFLAGLSVDISDEMANASQLAKYQAELEEANRTLLQLSVTDSLTGLRNRRAFDERLAIEFTRSRRHGRDLSVVLLDIDDFKKVNDQHGHAAGDAVLRKLAEVLGSTVRTTDMAARHGGEEFVVLLPDASVTKAVQWAERFRAALSEISFDHGKVTVSMGVAGLADARTAGDFVERADEALYAAKRGGKDAVVPYEPRFRMKAHAS